MRTFCGLGDATPTATATKDNKILLFVSVAVRKAFHTASGRGKKTILFAHSHKLLFESKTRDIKD